MIFFNITGEQEQLQAIIMAFFKHLIFLLKIKLSNSELVYLENLIPNSDNITTYSLMEN